jgi:hypothetical protein
MAIQLIEIGIRATERIESYSSKGAASVELASGNGESHAYVVHFEPGGSIGPHPAGFDQLFLPANGTGWIAGSDGVRLEISPSVGAFVPTGEVHSKGSEVGMIAVMFQANRFALAGAPGR